MRLRNRNAYNKIMTLRSPSKVIYISIVIVILILGANADVESSKKSSNLNIYLPKKNDAVVYYESLKRIVEFCKTHKNSLDLNFGFGLFLVNVNLKKVLHNKARRLPYTLKTKLTRMINQNEELIDFFKFMTSRSLHPKHSISKMIATLFFQDSFWVHELPEYKNKILTKTRRGQYENTSWLQYMDSVNNLAGGMPTPVESDRCLAGLASNPISSPGSSFTCNITEKCREVILNGTNFGYALTHRLLFMLAARLGRGCFVFSPKLDDVITTRLCGTIYDEAQYIAKHDFQLVDLLMEQISLCTLTGNVEILQRSWLNDVLKFQNPLGCFGEDRNTARFVDLTADVPRPWRITSTQDQSLLNGKCNGHVTAVAAATLASGLRFILELYF